MSRTTDPRVTVGEFRNAIDRVSQWIGSYSSAATPRERAREAATVAAAAAPLRLMRCARASDHDRKMAARVLELADDIAREADAAMPALPRGCDVEEVIDAATCHGDENLDHTIGDLETVLRLAWHRLTPAAKREILARDEVQTVLSFHPGASAPPPPALVTFTAGEQTQPYKVRTSCGHIVIRRMRPATAGVPYSTDVVIDAPGGRPCPECEARE